ncbi:MAG TPA: hypothetical protein VF633_00360 [Brevundimonas sp.]|jgi:hypothetical protein
MSEDRIEIAGASLRIWRDAPSWDGRRTAALGDFACIDAGSGVQLLAQAQRQLGAEGIEALVGPMNGDTWSTHRLVVESDGRPPFLMEPADPPHYPVAFEQAGWSVVGRYASAEGPLPDTPSPAASPPGIALSSFDLHQAEAELADLHRVSLAAFTRGFLYRPLSQEAFIAQYQPVLSRLDPELVVMARDDVGNLQGFLFAIPDLVDPSPERAVILKTYASLQPGLGSSLARRFYAQAAARGYRRVVHALMHDDNLSARHSARLGATVFRRYALWGSVL